MNATTPNLATNAGAPRRSPNHRARRRLPYLGAVLLVGLIVAGLWPRPIPVEIGRVTTGPLRARVSEEGKTRIRHRYWVSAPVTGQLRRITLKAGATVKANETVVAVIEPVSPTLLDARSRTLAEARRDTASANLQKALVDLTYAGSELQRFEKLYADQTISIQELEAARWREASAAKNKTVAESALRQAEAELAEASPEANGSARVPTEVRAPVSGVVLRVVEESARVVASGTALLEIGDPLDLEIVIEVLSRDGAAIAPGTRVEMEQWGGPVPLEGKVRLVEPAAFTKVSALGVEEQRVNVVVDLVTPPEQRRGLGDGFRVEANIIVWEADQVLKVPSGALFRQGQNWTAWWVGEGRARLRQVQVGRVGGLETQILDGLREGDPVILYPGDRVREGQRVRAITL